MARCDRFDRRFTRWLGNPAFGGVGGRGTPGTLSGFDSNWIRCLGQDRVGIIGRL